MGKGEMKSVNKMVIKKGEDTEFLSKGIKEKISN